MPTLPWTPADAADWPASAGGTAADEVVVLASRLELRRLRTVPAFLAAAMRVRAQVRRSPGAIGVSLVAQPGRRTFWTLSAWTDQAAIDAFVGTAPHRDIMRTFHDAMAGASFVTWAVGTDAVPTARSNAAELWRDARARLTTARNGGSR
jgi:quinol monooxygenase YgiN